MSSYPVTKIIHKTDRNKELYINKSNAMTTLVKHNSFPSIRNMMDNFWNKGQLFNDQLSNMPIPAVNIQESENSYTVEVSAPGFEKQDLKVTTEHGMLTISAEKKTDAKVKDGHYTRQEFSRTAVYRSFALPEDVLPEGITAKYENGVLLLDLNKTPADDRKSSQITIS